MAPPAPAVYIDGAEHQRLYARLEGSSDPRGVVWYVLGPEIGSGPLYPVTTKALHQAGFVTAAVHPRGAGYSTGLRGDVDDYRLVLGDYDLSLRWLSHCFHDKPLFLLGHSSGAAFALRLGARSGAAIAGIVLVNPAYKLTYAKGMGPSLGDYFVYAGNYTFRPAALTVDMNENPRLIAHEQDRAEALAMQKDPLVVRYFSLRYLSAQKKVMDSSLANIGSTVAPLLFIQGAEDALVDPKGSDELLAAARSQDKRKLVAPEAGHGSSAVETMTAPLVAWLLARAPRSHEPGQEESVVLTCGGDL